MSSTGSLPLRQPLKSRIFPLLPSSGAGFHPTGPLPAYLFSWKDGSPPPLSLGDHEFALNASGECLYFPFPDAGLHFLLTLSRPGWAISKTPAASESSPLCFRFRETTFGWQEFLEFAQGSFSATSPKHLQRSLPAPGCSQNSAAGFADAWVDESCFYLTKLQIATNF